MLIDIVDLVAVLITQSEDGSQMDDRITSLDRCLVSIEIEQVDLLVRVPLLCWDFALRRLVDGDDGVALREGIENCTGADVTCRACDGDGQGFGGIEGGHLDKVLRDGECQGEWNGVEGKVR